MVKKARERAKELGCKLVVRRSGKYKYELQDNLGWVFSRKINEVHRQLDRVARRDDAGARLLLGKLN